MIIKKDYCLQFTVLMETAGTLFKCIDKKSHKFNSNVPLHIQLLPLFILLSKQSKNERAFSGNFLL